MKRYCEQDMAEFTNMYMQRLGHKHCNYMWVGGYMGSWMQPGTPDFVKKYAPVAIDGFYRDQKSHQLVECGGDALMGCGSALPGGGHTALEQFVSYDSADNRFHQGMHQAHGGCGRGCYLPRIPAGQGVYVPAGRMGPRNGFSTPGRKCRSSSFLTSSERSRTPLIPTTSATGTISGCRKAGARPQRLPTRRRNLKRSNGKRDSGRRSTTIERNEALTKGIEHDNFNRWFPRLRLSDRYYFVPGDAKADPISGAVPRKLKYCAGGVWKESATSKYMPCYDPSTGAVIAYAPQCTAAEVEEAIEAGAKAFPAWRDTPVAKRTQVLFRMKQLLDEHLDELTYLCAQENGKKWDEAKGDVLKVDRGGGVCLRARLI